MNHVLFSSQKHSLKSIRIFSVKPEWVGKRLLQAIRLDADAKTLKESHGIWQGLYSDLPLKD
ncbi:MAG: hypothetical protein IKR36_00960 [Clostridia bacterium]|nr:hypothetical protein [Clostridia bacterium]